MITILALLGFAPTAVQTSRPPLLAYLLACPVAYFAAELVEVVTFFVQWASFGYATRWGVSVVFRTLGVLGALLIVHGVVRGLVFRDDLSWSGWFRKQLVG